MMQYLELSEFEQKLENIFNEIKKMRQGKVLLVTPLGAGKPHYVLNKIYQYAKDDQEIKLTILTALSLTRPNGKSCIEKSFFGKVDDKVFGNCPELDYTRDLINDTVPENITIKEFFLHSPLGSESSYLQRNHISLNYSQVLDYLLNEEDIGLLVQILGTNSKSELSLGPNPDLTKDIISYYKNKEKRPLFIAQVSRNVPFIDKTEPENWDYILDCKESHHQLFSIPNLPINYQHWLIGIFTSVLIKDGGTLQIGIGQIADSTCSALLLRQFNNELYKKILQDLKILTFYEKIIKEFGGVEPFSEGISICTEMMTPGLLELFKKDIAKKVLKDSSGGEAILRAAFFLGGQDFYKELDEIPEKLKQSLRMESVLLTNTLELGQKKLADRPEARFVNFSMYASVFGEAMSETTETGQVIGGVGGQFDFGIMAPRLRQARNILAFKARRYHKGKIRNNIHYEGGHVTIPRHIRDIFITEYGIADLRYKSDEEVILEMIRIASPVSRNWLLKKSIKEKKVLKNILPKALSNKVAYSGIKKINHNKTRSNVFPFGSSLNKTEQKGLMLLLSLKENYGTTCSSMYIHFIYFLRSFFLGERLERNLRNLFELDKLSLLKRHFYESLLLLEQERLKKYYPVL